MGLTDRRKTAKKLVVKIEKFKPVSRKLRKKINRKRICSLDLLLLREILNSLMFAFSISLLV